MLPSLQPIIPVTNPQPFQPLAGYNGGNHAVLFPRAENTFDLSKNTSNLGFSSLNTIGSSSLLTVPANVPYILVQQKISTLIAQKQAMALVQPLNSGLLNEITILNQVILF